LNKLNDFFANESENNANSQSASITQNEKERKEFLEKLKSIRQTLINDLMSRKKLITMLSEKIQDEKDCFFTYEDEKLKIPQ